MSQACDFTLKCAGLSHRVLKFDTYHIPVVLGTPFTDIGVSN